MRTYKDCKVNLYLLTDWGMRLNVWGYEIVSPRGFVIETKNGFVGDSDETREEIAKEMPHELLPTFEDEWAHRFGD